MWRGNLHTGTTYSLKDSSDLLYFFIKVGSESICQITLIREIGKGTCLRPFFIDHFGVLIVFGLKHEIVVTVCEFG